ncbi:hypothetical protein [Shouchella miscanthi]|uniref:ABC3 transporter permease protein domain-containing protein n=1 Tax=Shouchella miscanthi TaxID=2598861 RepID=A0ABU6NT74_9BACI|nr:hypothetical protein [Shouchella miscanthi]
MKKFIILKIKMVVSVVAVLMVLISAVSYMTGNLMDARKEVKQEITDFSRGAYDILLRPEHARSEVEIELGLVEENYLGIGSGGISVAQWAEIKNHPQVEIAAPVAAIGSFHARERTFMFQEVEEDKSRYYEVNYMTSDGHSTYINQEKTFMYHLLDERPETEGVSLYPSNIDMFNSYFVDFPSFDFPLSYHPVVAVDAEEESKLTNTDLEPLHEKTIGDMYSYNNGELVIPIMSLQDVSPPNTIELTTDYLKTYSVAERDEWEASLLEPGYQLALLMNDKASYDQDVISKLAKLRMYQENKLELEPPIGMSPFEQHALYINEQQQLSNDHGEGLVASSHAQHPHRSGYKVEPIRYEIDDQDQLFVRQTGVDAFYAAPQYRDISQVDYYQIDEFGQPIDATRAFEFSETGKFSIEENMESLASAPLGIYGSELPYLKHDKDIRLHPSAIPGSFVTTPAHGMIAIEHAEKIKGEAPIDAIRVRVADIAGYDEAGQGVIKDLAQLWEKSGFTVDIVAGSSLKELTVDVEGLGAVVQQWTTLGAADTIVASWNTLQIVVTALLVLVGSLFLLYLFMELIRVRKKDEVLLAELGWATTAIKKIAVKEWSLLLGLPIVFITILFVIVGMLNQQLLYIMTLLLSILGVGVLFFLAIVLSTRIKDVKPPKKVGSIRFQNVLYYRKTIVAAVIQVFLLTILSSFLPIFLFAEIGRATETRLGIHVHGQIEATLIATVVLLYILGVFTVWQSLNRLWNIRFSELQLFHYLGWSKQTISRYLFNEIFLWVAPPILLGFVISLIMSHYFAGLTVNGVLAGMFAGSLIFVFVTIISKTIVTNKLKGRKSNVTTS